ncbi:hypothetical protein M0Q97_09000 [Candidatus Dojkabacteria bacterium]|jgi:hypothetical protein|nr:hypothetical protein [Candidatus Dojkabacteria bacterium]
MIYDEINDFEQSGLEKKMFKLLKKANKIVCEHNNENEKDWEIYSPDEAKSLLAEINSTKANNLYEQIDKLCDEIDNVCDEMDNYEDYD